MSLVVVTYAAVATGNLLLRAADYSPVPGYLTPSAGVIERIVARTKDSIQNKKREEALKATLTTQEFKDADAADLKAADQAVARTLASVPADQQLIAAIRDAAQLRALLKDQAAKEEAALLSTPGQAAFRAVLDAAVNYATKTALASPDLSKLAHRQELRDLAELSDELRTLNERITHVPAKTVSLLAGGKVLDLQRTVPPGRKIEQPSRLLVPTSGVFPFVDRGGLLEDLVSWADDPTAFSVRILGGSGGSGKSRLAVELCRILRRRGDFWKAGFLHSDANRFPAALGTLTTFPGGRLIVMDYAETRTVDVAEVLETLPESATSFGPVRVLLLVRNPSGTPASLDDVESWVDAVRATRREDANRFLDEAGCTLLDAALFWGAEREALFKKALEQLPPYLGLPATSASGTVDTGFLKEPEFTQPLYVVMAAYLQLVGTLNATDGPKGLFEGVLEHEAEYWRSQARLSHLDLKEPELRPLVALATLTDARDEAEGLDLLSRVRYLPGDANALTRERAQVWLRQLYPGQAASQWGQLLPDRLGEYLVAKELTNRPELIAAAIDPKRSPTQWIRPFTVLARAGAVYDALASATIPFSNRLLPAWSEQCHKLANAREDPWASSPVIEALVALVEALGRHREPTNLIRVSPLFGTGNPLLTRLALALPFVDRDRLLEDLAAWVDSTDAFSVHILGGAGGTGKSQLAVELCRHTLARSDLWHVCFLEKDDVREACASLRATPGGRLIVIDYAETRTLDVATVLTSLQGSATWLEPVRVLLLVRNPSGTPASPDDTKPWVEALRAARHEDADRLLDVAGCSLLDPRPLDPDDRRTLFNAAIRNLPPYLALGSDRTPRPVDLSFLDHPEFDRPLDVAMAAYLQLLGALESVLEHETENWQKVADLIRCSPRPGRAVVSGIGRPLDSERRHRRS